eukprot:1961071-Pyramimonas_sp.AAC.1
MQAGETTGSAWPRSVVRWRPPTCDRPAAHTQRGQRHRSPQRQSRAQLVPSLRRFELLGALLLERGRRTPEEEQQPRTS